MNKLCSNEDAISTNGMVCNDRKKMVRNTPFCIIHTKSGTIPHLTKETFSYIDPKLTDDLEMYQVGLSGMIEYRDSFKAAGCASKLFALPPNSTIYCTVQDPSSSPSPGYNTTKTVAVWSASGKTNVTPQSYMEIIEELKPDFYQSLADSDIPELATRKRVIKSVNRTIQFLEECMKTHMDSTLLQDTKLVCLIEGGSFVDERKRCATEILSLEKQYKDVSVLGYVIDDLLHEPVISSHTKDLIKSVIEILSEDKSIIVHGVGHPWSIICLVELGVTVFDTAHLSTLVNKNLALIYTIPRLEEAQLDCVKQCYDQVSDKDFNLTLDLSNLCEARSFKPVLEGCTCYTCTHHTRAYIQHLVTVNEMLAPVLLMIHNLHHHLTFFKALQYANRTEKDFINFKSEFLRLNKVE